MSVALCCLLSFQFCTVLAIYMAVNAEPDVRLPPSILRHPLNETERVVDMNQDTDRVVRLECLATGTQSPRYEWRKNGRPIGLATNIRVENTAERSTIEIAMEGPRDEGSYQCLARNDFGTAVSRPAVLRLAVLKNSPNLTASESQPIQEGHPATLKCNKTESYPRATISWVMDQFVVGRPAVDYKFDKAVRTDNRIQIDDEGSLHFAYVTLADATQLYRCNMYSEKQATTRGVSHSKLNVLPGATGTLPPQTPSLLFSSPSTVIALKGHDVSLRCFFSGNPVPKLHWSKVGSPLPYLRHEKKSFETELVIKHVVESDAGEYECRTASNTGPVRKIKVIVQAAPVFLSPADHPQNVNRTEGESVTFMCRAQGVPEPVITWMRDGEPLQLAELSARYNLSEDRTKLTITDLCKDCQDGDSDLAVIQCHASNEHGSAFQQGYINVLKRTKLVERPSTVYGSHTETLSVSLRCNASTDDSTRLNVSWYRVYDEKSTGGAGEQVVHSVPNKISIGEGGRSLNITLWGNTNDWSRYGGKYKCAASNGYSRDEAEFSIDMVGPTFWEILAKYWWAFMLAAALLLFFIGICFWCLCCRPTMNKGTYLVDMEERIHGNNPISEIEGSRLQEYQRPEEPIARVQQLQLGGSARSSQCGSLRGLHAATADTVSVYAMEDLTEYDETGSFIGPFSSTNRGIQTNTSAL